MKLESQLIAELWVVVRDAIPAAQKHEIAMQFLKTFEDFGMGHRDMADVQDEDPHLEAAYLDLFAEELEEDAEETEDEEYRDN